MDDCISNRGGNKTCIICSGRNPTWGCFPFGILCCTKCAGSFRSLDTSLCKVQSLLLDAVSEDFLSLFRRGGNALFLSWFEKKNRNKELTPEYFQTPEAQTYAQLLSQGKLEEPAKQRPTTTAQPNTRLKSKLALAQESESDSETGSEEESAESASSDTRNARNARNTSSASKESKESKDLKNQAEESEASFQPKRAIRRVPGKISTGEGSARLGMFKNVEKEEKEALHKKTASLGSEAYTPTREIVRGEGFMGSADIPEQTVSDKIKQSIEKGKKSFSAYLKNIRK
ncbi:hypothetical protein NEDG_01418 [Nematocida displodere]|uniref:Arf-GAP domain-containing protein n=1 Tax=Nematocida displodere TaxID=1805483 RepID=A0A177EBM6_9MICR|nr:hypothetical protein NEDG_01418 [Nematocida displodere]